MSKKQASDNVNIMLVNDQFSKWLGIEVLDIDKGFCRLKMNIKKEMLNGFGIVHGGILFSAADSAFAFASNSHGRLSVALDTSISFTNPAVLGDEIYVEAKEQYLGYKTGLYLVEIKNGNNELIALFKGNVYRTSKQLDDKD